MTVIAIMVAVLLVLAGTAWVCDRLPDSWDRSYDQANRLRALDRARRSA